MTVLPTSITRLYLIGPVTGYPNNNRSEFERVRTLLHQASNGAADIIVPHDFIPSTSTWQQAMSQSITSLVATDATSDGDTKFHFDGIVMLDDCDASCGATLERAIAETLHIPCYSWQAWLVHFEEQTKQNVY